jgi:hypothetical protein
MDLDNARRQIASMEHSLNKAKATAQVAPNDPALSELERIVARKIEELDTAMRNADLEGIFFADIDENNSEPRPLR